MSGNNQIPAGVMNNSFWIGVYPGLTKEMLDFAVDKIETYLGVNF